MSHSIELPEEVTHINGNNEQVLESENVVTEHRYHPLRLRISCYDIKTLKCYAIAKLLKAHTTTSFLVDKQSRRNFAFVQFKTAEDTERFLSEVQGKVLERQKIVVDRCQLEYNDELETLQKHYSKNKRQRNTNSNNDVIQVKKGLPSTLPYLIDLKQRRFGRFDESSITDKVTPLLGFSYSAQIQMKSQVIKTCVKSFTRKMFELTYEGRSTRDNKRHKPQLLPYGDHNGLENKSPPIKKLLWCHPEVAKGFHGCEIESFVPSPVCIGYRNKCEFTIGFNNEQHTQLEIGFVHKVLNHEPIVSSCSGILNVPYSMQEVCYRLKTIITEKMSPALPVFSRITGEGLWRLLMVRLCELTQSLLVVIQIGLLKNVVSSLSNDHSTNELITEDDLKKQIKELLIRELVVDSSSDKRRLYDGFIIQSLFIQERGQKSDAFDTDNFQLIYGQPYLLQSLMGLQFKVHPGAFFQTNIGACEVLYKRIFKLLNIKSGQLIFDICSGTGTIALCLQFFLKSQSIQFKKCIGIEIIPSAVKDAQENAKLNNVYEEGIGGVQFLVGKAEEVLPNVLLSIDPNDSACAIVDPPRAGLHPNVISSLIQCPQITQLVYVSCNPESLANDVVKLCTPSSHVPYPFKPIRTLGIDMFPHTFHTEMLLLLHRTTSSDFGASNGIILLDKSNSYFNEQILDDPQGNVEPQKISGLQKYKFSLLNRHDRLAVSRLANRLDLNELHQALDILIFKQKVPHSMLNCYLNSSKNNCSDQTEELDITPSIYKAKPNDILFVLDAISFKHPIDKTSLLPAYEVLTCLIDKFNLCQLLQLCNAMKRLSILHTPLITGIMKQLTFQIDKCILSMNIAQGNIGLILWAELSQFIYSSLSSQRYRYKPMFYLLENHFILTLRDIQIETFSKKKIQQLGLLWAKIFYWLAQLAIAQPERILNSLLNENLKRLLKQNILSVKAYSYWANAIIISELDKVDVYRDTLKDICIQIAPLLKDIPLHTFIRVNRVSRRSSSQFHYPNTCGKATHARLLRFIYGVRYFYPELYASLPDDIQEELERVQQLDEIKQCIPSLKMRKTISYILRKLRVFHFLSVRRGPIVVDILEHNQNLVWICGTWGSYYVNTRERTALYQSNERLLLAMGYNVAHIPFWQWSRLKSKRSRVELVRMARYYALRDRRQFNPNFGGWLLPYMSLNSRKAYAVQSKGNYFPNFEPLGLKTY